MTKKSKAKQLKYCNKVKNDNPQFETPAYYANRGRLAFINDAVEKSKQVDVLMSDVALWARKNNDRAKAFYKDRANAIRALVTCFIEHYDVATGLCKISLRRAADLCGLSTISQAEKDKAEKDPTYTPKVNICRATRAAKDMNDMGWINAPKCWQVWDKNSQHWIDKLFELTPLIFKAVGITPERLERQRKARIKYLARKGWLGMTHDEIMQTPISELKAITRNIHVRNVFERRAKQQQVAKLKRQMHGKTPEQQRNVAQARVIERLGAEVKFMADHLFSREINQELATIRRIVSPPQAT